MLETAAAADKLAAEVAADDDSASENSYDSNAPPEVNANVVRVCVSALS
eukprot:COSAG05_NODE_27_length_29281_cov_199.946919_13_plen_49_part_00